MTTDSLTVSRNAVIALSIIIPLIFIILLIIIFWLWFTLRRLQSHESDEFPLRSSHSTTSMPPVYSTTSVPPGFYPCFAVVGKKDSTKLFLEARDYKNPTGSYDRAFGHFRIVCNPSINDTGVDGVVMLDDASLSDKVEWAYTRKEVVFVGPDPVMPPCLRRNCTLGLVDPFPELLQKTSNPKDKPTRKRRSNTDLRAEIWKIPRIEAESHELLPRENMTTHIQHPSNATTIGAGPWMTPLEKFPCIIGVQYPSFCKDRSFKTLGILHIHLRRCHSYTNWCKDCLKSFNQALDQEDLAIAKATHKKECPKTPTQENINKRLKQFIMEDWRWEAFKRRAWEQVPTRYPEEPIVNRRYRKMHEMLTAPNEGRLPGIHETFSASSPNSHQIILAGSERHWGVLDDRNAHRGSTLNQGQLPGIHEIFSIESPNSH
ncbi:uncharacterized protein FMAN_15526 [Fusarium mangiferae]|uniref:Uncharacterized protein n=1 Tax=Fusarium mangiferae TaxID=192010 RepID=A0A1L7UJG6_FUSMA|nr:uncharacterized protein FMAN_15526 [Fusarium mangiferae]CVL09372.1 uncharacterized protein FMAN_15526 [Fusarium mangiferae]